MNQSRRKVSVCKGKTLKRVRCKKRTAQSKKCWIHLGKENNLRVKKSYITNSGKGLFASKKEIARKEKIGVYSGKWKSKEDINRRYPGNTIAQYVVCARTKCIDARDTNSNAVRYANDGKSRNRNNSNFAVKRGKIILKATKRIPPHTEIYANYGNDYWN